MLLSYNGIKENQKAIDLQQARGWAKGDLRVSLCWLPLLYGESKLSASGGREHVVGGQGQALLLVLFCVL